MFSKNIALIASIAFISLTATPVLSDPIYQGNFSEQMREQNFNKDRENGWEKGRIFERLNLTESQKKQIDTLRNSHYNEMKPLKDQIRNKENELRNLMVNNASNDQLKNKHNEIQNLRQKLGNLHFENMLEIRAVLTPEQRNQFGQMMGYRGGDRGPRR